jgi:hypothetical protein
MKTILSQANLIDCVEPKVRPDTAVLIEDGRIRAILPSGETGSAGDARVIDLKGGYLMPGLWDVHTHPDYLSPDEMPLADQVTLVGHRLVAALTESGIIGLRCAGAHHFMDVAWKAFDSGQHLGPRLFASGYFLTTTGGHFLTSGHALEVDGREARGLAGDRKPILGDFVSQARAIVENRSERPRRLSPGTTKTAGRRLRRAHERGRHRHRWRASAACRIRHSECRRRCANGG